MCFRFLRSREIYKIKPSTMKKIKYEVKIGQFITDFKISDLNDSYNDQKILRYMKASLMKSGINYNDLIKENLNIDVEKCPFCGSDSKYEISYLIDRPKKVLDILGIEYIIKGGMINYHCKSGKNNCSGSRLNSNSIEYISKAFKISKEKARAYIIDRNKSPFYAKNHDSKEDYKKFQTRNLDWYISKYGDYEGRSRYQNFKDKVSNGNTKESIITNHGIDSYNDMIRRKKVCTIEHFISKYGEELGKSKFDEYKKSLGLTRDNYIKKFGKDSWDKRAEIIKYKKSLEFYIQKLGQEEGRKDFRTLRESYSFNKEKYIEKYGEEKWIERYKNFNLNFYSKEASVFLNKLLGMLIDLELPLNNIKMERDEFFLWDTEYRRIYFYDLYFECFSKKIIVEYDNEFWHPKNENDTSAWDKLKIDHKFTKSEKIEYDERKRMFAKYKGYDIINISYSGQKNPLRKNNEELWEPLLIEVLNKIKNIIRC